MIISVFHFYFWHIWCLCTLHGGHKYRLKATLHLIEVQTNSNKTSNISKIKHGIITYYYKCFRMRLFHHIGIVPVSFFENMISEQIVRTSCGFHCSSCYNDSYFKSLFAFLIFSHLLHFADMDKTII